ncbi:hypothetical protein CORC01_14457 [Colletotrichum orchidophilum]|uniref:Uncharacterized protein n=1 Tax=Colletotrichum orchidophilum TaxID=1209926 RepID=A0A1G4AMD0_9PEZI|nr:hypothetical protein CORC01_14457 [Colletotrichum orchidophilum]
MAASPSCYFLDKPRHHCICRDD